VSSKISPACLEQRLQPPVVPLALVPPPPPPKLGLLQHFAGLKDPRLERARHHELSAILVIAFCAVLGGADSFSAIERFGKAKRAWFARFLALPHGIPSHDTFRRVFALLDPVAFQECFVNWINAVCDRIGLKRYQIDGKALRGSRKGKLGCLHTVSVWADEAGLSVGQVQVEDKSNEITAIPLLLQLLDLHGAIVSIDAIGCQKEIAKLIRQQGGDYLLAVKENQPTLYADVKACFERALATDLDGVSFDEVATEDDGHGRREERTYTVIYDPEGLRTAREWKDLKTIIMVRRERWEGQKYSHEVSYYISSSDKAAEILAAAVRGHWGIENGCHWILDVVFGEDGWRCREGNAPQNLAWLRRVALSVLKRDTSKDSIKGKRQRAGWDNDFLEDLLSLLDLPSQMEDA
jgi:predicted transposase YbfD/YdcC